MRGLAQREGPAVVEIQDDGPGLPTPALERVFEPFYRGQASRDRTTGGIGLGLALVRSVVGPWRFRPAAGYLARVVLAASAVLAVTGFLPGLVLCALLYDAVAAATFLPLTMTLGRAGLVFALVFGMCLAAGLLAMRQLRDADPADMF